MRGAAGRNGRGPRGRPREAGKEKMARWQFTKGLHDLGAGGLAYLTPDGGWSLSNAGIVYDGGEAIVIDTLTDRRLTDDMIRQFKAAAPVGTRITSVINTHAHPDHSWGNGCFVGHEIICSDATMAEFNHANPAARRARLEKAAAEGHVGARFYFDYMAAAGIDRSGGTTVKPTRSFSKRLNLAVGGRSVQLIEVGPAHTSGDVIAYVPANRLVMTGDILFSSGHPLLSVGSSVDGWVKACDLILSLDAEVIIPGHGPIADKTHVAATKNYFSFVRNEVRKRFEAGLTAEDAAEEISLDAFSDWGEPERIVANVAYIYEELKGEKRGSVDALEGYALMARYKKRHSR
jgi:cyclase